MLFLNKNRAKLVVMGISFITIIYYWLVVYSKCGNANVFLFICFNKGPESFWISFQAVSNVVVNIAQLHRIPQNVSMLWLPSIGRS